MKRALASVLVAGLGLAAFSTASLAGQNNNAKILIHLLPKSTKNICGVRGQPACNAVVTAGTLYPTLYYAYLVVTDGNAAAGLGGLQCGIQYAGGTPSGSPIAVFSWANCATLEFQSGGWPAPNSGNLITWDTATKCQRFEPSGAGTGVAANAGYFYMAAYAPATFAVIPRPVDGKLKVADCASNEDLIGGSGAVGIAGSHMGFANFTSNGLAPGYNPCGANTPVQATTWSAIKATLK